MKYTVKPIVCDYAVVRKDTDEIIHICNIKSNAELIADILNADTDDSYAYSYNRYPNAKYKVIKAEGKEHFYSQPDSISTDILLELLHEIPPVIPKQESVLNKIRAEIEEQIEKQKECPCFDNDDMFAYITGLNDAIDIVKKYKTKSIEETKEDIEL